MPQNKKTHSSSLQNQWQGQVQPTTQWSHSKPGVVNSVAHHYSNNSVKKEIYRSTITPIKSVIAGFGASLFQPLSQEALLPQHYLAPQYY